MNERMAIREQAPVEQALWWYWEQAEIQAEIDEQENGDE